MTQADLGRQLNVTATMVSHWEKAKKHPSAEQLLGMANIFDVTMDELVRPVTGEQRARLLLQLDLRALQTDLGEAASAVRRARKAVRALDQTLGGEVGG